MIARLGGIPHLDLGGRRCGDLHRLVVDRGLDQHAGRRIARLAGVAHAVQHTALDRLLHIHIGKDDVGRLAAEFLRDALDRLGSRFRHRNAGAGGAREGHELDVRMHRQRIADFNAGAVHHVEDARRVAGFVHALGKDLRRQRALLGRLQDHGAAGEQRRGDLGGDLVHRPVPRRDETADADRLAHHVAARAAAHFPVKFARGFEGLLDMTRAALRLGVVRKVLRRTHLRGDRFGHFAVAAHVHLQQLFHERDALIQRGQGVALKRAVRGCDSQVGVIRRTHRDLRHLLFRGRIHDRKASHVRHRTHEGAVDIVQ